MISAIGRVPVERSTDYTQRQPIDLDDEPIGPTLGPKIDGTALMSNSNVTAD
jgi:FO synthase subunit 2